MDVREQNPALEHALEKALEMLKIRRLSLMERAHATDRWLNEVTALGATTARTCKQLAVALLSSLRTAVPVRSVKGAAL